MTRIRWQSRKTFGILLGVLILYFTIRVRKYEHKTSVSLNVHPNEAWEFVADFSNMKYLNPTITDFVITEESGNYKHWKYTTEYVEKLSHWPYLPNYSTAHFEIKATTNMDKYFINSYHRTCMFNGLYCRKVPALLDNGKITIESLDISDYLDEKYPQNPLYSSDPKIKQHEKELIQKIAPVVSGFYSFLLNNQEHATEEQISELLAPLQPFEEELSKKGGKFFGGDKPNMVDYMFWPWAERSEATVRKSKGQNLLTDDKIPNLQKWKKAMKEDRAVSEIYHSPEEHWKVFEYRIYKTPLDYDTL
ncbi:glutathione transferase omega-1-like isoform X2 [Sitophilus oryzae]|uniref:Glutathione-dependent dehydroascorbate reductase n=1 Tax=Sitophilus oryzae TaxID=7048 RepID=A0A6J2XGZ5_SITOR|nr:glutathione transferase omega-1-like isoform X2 [Sitophilus oryzae]